MSDFKYCIVPGCKSTSIRCPEKLFITVPKDEKVRMMWIKASRRDLKKSPLSMNSYLTCCGDHFDFENDIENWVRYKFYKESGLNAHIRLKKGVVPTRFECQKGRNIIKPRVSAGEKLERKKMLASLLEEGKTDACSAPVQQEEATSASTSEVHYLESDPVEEASSRTASNKETQTEVILQDRTAQVNIKPKIRSKCVQTENLDFQVMNPTSDTATQMTPTKRVRCLSEESHATSSSGPSVSSSDFIPTSSSIEEPQCLLLERMKKISLESTTFYIKTNSKMYVGISERCFESIEFFASRINCLPRNIELVLMKIKTDFTFDFIGHLFGISNRQASRIFNLTLPKLAAELKQLIIWPAQEDIEKLLPIPFRHKYTKVQSIIDCFEIEIEKPSDPENQSLTWSEYYKANTFKYMVSSTPNGFINFVSKGYGGRTTDTNLTIDCGYLNCLPSGSQVLADRGFKHLAPHLAPLNELVRPPSVPSGYKLNETEAKLAKRVASLRIHIERVIGRIREYRMVSPKALIDNKLTRYLDAIVLVVAGLVNLQDSMFSS